MASLTDLFPIGSFITGGAAGEFNTLYVYNSSVDSPANGGACCLWTVPADANWIKFEVWGAGGSGPGGCCCQQPAQSGGAGAYARKTIPAVPGETYTVCAGGTGCCATTCCGVEGFASFVNGGSEINGTRVDMCAAGGPTSCAQCFRFSGGTFCGNTNTCRSGSWCGADFGLPAISGASNSGTCGFQGWQYVPNGPYIGSGVRHGKDFCITVSGCDSLGGFANFPGGGGGGATTGGGACCWGGFGAGGLVIISYR